MKTVANATLGGWIGVDPDQIRQELESLFPGVRAWFGEYTGQWWALLGGRLVEAADPLTLAERIRKALAPTPAAPAVRPRYARRPSTTGAAAQPFVPHTHRAAPRAAAPVHHARPAGFVGRVARRLGWTSS